MEFTARQIADYIGGRIEGDENTTVNSFAKIEEGKRGTLSFLSNPKYVHYIYETQSSIVIVNEDIELYQEVSPTIIRVNDAYNSIASLMQLYESVKPKKCGIDSLSSISPTAKIGDNVYVGAFATIGDGTVVGDGTRIYPHTVVGDNVTIGKDCLLYPNITIYDSCKLGDRVTIHSGSVIGADGFGFAPNTNGYDKLPQIGIVVIEDDVEIGANTCVDRSTMGCTLIRKGVKLDNLIQVAHNVEIGENTVMSSQVGIAGSTKIGSWCMFGGQVGVAGHLTVGDRTLLGAKTGVIGNIKGNDTLMGVPPINPRLFFKSQAIVHRLPEMYKQLNEMQKQIDELKKKLSDE